MAPGIYRHVMAWRLRYCHELGYRVVVDATIVGKMPSLRSQDTYDPRIRALCAATDAFYTGVIGTNCDA